MKIKRTFYINKEVSELLDKLPRSITLSEFVSKAISEALKKK